jgi:N-formylglutamate deformylase
MHTDDRPTCTLHRGTRPLLVSLPHDGSAIPPDLAARMTPEARRAPDTDWCVSRLYAFARELGASVLVPRYARYAVDLNRPPDDVSLYPGQNTTGLCPTVRFDGGAVYLPGAEPDATEIAARVARFWRPYHDTLRAEIARLRAAHGRVLVWEGHSIRGTLPFLFEGRLPDLNLGTVGGASCRPATQARLEAALAAQSDYDWVANGRFKGGYITRHYAAPADSVETVQLEIAQRIYMHEDADGTRSAAESEAAYDETLAGRAQRVIERLMLAALG